MKSLLQRLLPSVFGSATSPTRAALAPSSSPAAKAPGRAPAAQGAQAQLIGARRPLISNQGEIVGFEFRVADDMARRLTRQGNPAAAAAHARAVLGSASLVVRSGRVGLARLPLLCLPEALNFDTLAGLWISVEGARDEPAETAMAPALLQLRARGAKVTWTAAPLPGLVPDLVLLSQGDVPMATLVTTLATRPSALQGLPTLVTDVREFEDLQLALQHGIDYACGALSVSLPTRPPGQTLSAPPEVTRIGQLLNLLVKGADNAALVSQIKSDVGLSVRLLQRINTASFAHLEINGSIEQAVAMLGRSELYRWLSMLLFQFAGKSRSASAAQEITLWRARFLELLGQATPTDAPSQLFTLGLASMIGPLLGISQNDVLQILALPEAARDALQQAGPWWPFLELAQHIEAQTPSQEHSLVRQLGGMDAVLALSDQAWDWAWATTHATPST
ncbi:MAG: HDOD domain-containing protein [Aquabacterium sp.]|nr:HDOD domain-containing protein [Aquabacterium sp.]